MNVIAPARRLAALRLLTGLFAVTYLVIRLPYFLDLTTLAADRWEPPGVLGPLGSPPSAGLMHVLLALTIVAGLAYLAGWRYRWSGPAFGLLLLVVMSYRNAWGHLFHTDNLLVLHVLIIGLAPAAAAWSLDARGRTEPADDVRFGWPVRLAAVVTVLTYVVTGVAKLRYAGLDWLGGDTLLHQIAFDNARKKVLGDTYSPLAAAFAAHPGVFRPMGLLTLVVELAAPVALLSRRWAWWWSGTAWVFHVGIVALMWISFPYPLSFVAFAPFFRCERPFEWVLARRPVRGRAGMTIQQAQELVQESSAVAVLTGAGISTDSGIPDFRGPNGVWTKNPEAEKKATLQHYLADPEVRKQAWRNRLDSAAWQAEPNPGHLALVELEGQGRLHTLITQNIDGLHQAAGSDPDLVVEVHGTIREVSCLNCGERAPMERALARVRAGEEDPECRTCGGILKSATISFGQSLIGADLARAEQAALSCDLMLAIGSTLAVYPICDVVPIAKQAGAAVVIVNAEPTQFDHLADAVVRDSISAVLPELVRESLSRPDC